MSTTMAREPKHAQVGPETEDVVQLKWVEDRPSVVRDPVRRNALHRLKRTRGNI